MWPWEHAAFGYVLYSLLARVGYRRTPRSAPAVVAVVAAVLPDLIDKPLAWTFGVFASGYSVAHSVFVGLPAILLIAAAARRRGAAASGLALVVGYASHLVGDVVYPALIGNSIALSPLLWPLVETSASPTAGVFLDRFGYYFARYLRVLFSAEYWIYLLLQVALALSVVGLWLRDGKPGLAAVRGE